METRLTLRIFTTGRGEGLGTRGVRGKRRSGGEAGMEYGLDVT